MNKRLILLIFLAAFLGSIFAQACGMGVTLWYRSERENVMALGKSPSPVFCWVMSVVNYYGFTHEEQHQCESILHPKPMRPSMHTARSI
jgi:hypothetical protein